MAEQTISLTLKEYEELIEFKTKANQYKGKNLYQLIKENEKENKEEK